LREAFMTLWRRKTFRFLAAGGASHAFVVFAAQNWNAAVLRRVHQMPIGQVALFLALAVRCGRGPSAQFVGGWMADRLGRHLTGAGTCGCRRSPQVLLLPYRWLSILAARQGDRHGVRRGRSACC
jgi:hypothetical protein